MKNLSLIFLVLLAVLIPNIGQSFNSTLLIPTDGTKEIFLDGTLDDTASRSPQRQIIRATINPFVLNIEFLTNTGDIDVEVSSADGSLVYEHSVNTETQTSLSINVSNWDNGIYEIRFTDSDGNYMYGTFEI